MVISVKNRKIFPPSCTLRPLEGLSTGAIFYCWESNQTRMMEKEV